MTEEQSFIPTRASMLKGVNKVEEVTFTSYKPKNKKILQDDDEGSTIQQNSAFNIKKAKNEVIKLGMSTLEGQEKKDAKIQLLIKLGAKPPRKKYINYKELQKERKEKKAAEQSNAQLQQIGKNILGKSTAKDKFDKKRRKDQKFKNKGLLDVYDGKVKPNN
ncbi:hypothetical protein WA026_005504 [Henosepilachna vigintioctopunctata]|uniref:Uncharacterized protein n=1 Tax=Henosepilachna vigintioctopunctata TaxID=420089 RepID=A0AAW1TV69_9CUCU